MIIYRIANREYRDDLSGNGAALYGSRWNSTGVRIVYASEFISLCILESLVHLRRHYIPGAQYLLHIEIHEPGNIGEISYKKIRHDWWKEVQYTQWMGDQFIKNSESLVLKVPSVVVPQEHNFLINPLHRDFKKVKIISSEPLNLDKRLLLQ